MWRRVIEKTIEILLLIFRKIINLKSDCTAMGAFKRAEGKFRSQRGKPQLSDTFRIQLIVTKGSSYSGHPSSNGSEANSFIILTVVSCLGLALFGGVLCASCQRFKCSRIFLITSFSVMKLIIFISPWHLGHSSGSTSQIFLIHSRQVGEGIRLGL